MNAFQERLQLSLYLNDTSPLSMKANFSLRLQVRLFGMIDPILANPALAFANYFIPFDPRPLSISQAVSHPHLYRYYHSLSYPYPKAHPLQAQPSVNSCFQ